MPAPANRPIDVANAKALARQSVVYCSGSHSVYIAKFAPPRPRKNNTRKNHASAPLEKKTTQPNPIDTDRTITRKYTPSVGRRPKRSAIHGSATQPRIVPAESSIVPYDASDPALAAVRPVRSAISRTDVGTYTDPAHNPMIDTSR